MYKFVLFFLAGYAILVALLYLYQRNILFVPGKTIPIIANSVVPEMIEIFLKTDDGLDLRSWFFKGEENKPIIIYFQGNAGTIFDRDYKARQFIDHGYSLLFVGYRGYGGNPGTPNEKGFLLDSKAAIDFVEREKFNPNDIVLYGESLGTGVAINLAREVDVGSVILEAPYASITKVASERYWFVPVRYLLKDKFDSISKIKGLTTPLLIIHGDQDDVISLQHGKLLFSEASEPKYMQIFEGANHGNLYEHDAIKAVDSFIKRHR